MTNHPAYFDKIVNPELARTALCHTDSHGEFTATVRLASPEQCPEYMQAIELEIYAPNFLKVRIPCAEIERVADDDNVLSIELREHISSGGMF